MKTLNLNLTRKWLDLILSGEKKEEYREVKEYWVRRLISLSENMEFSVWDEFINDLQSPYKNHADIESLLNYFNAKFKQFDNIKFKNGYQKNAPSFLINLKYIELAPGIARLGAKDGIFYFVLKLGEIIKCPAPK